MHRKSKTPNSRTRTETGEVWPPGPLGKPRLRKKLAALREGGIDGRYWRSIYTDKFVAELARKHRLTNQTESLKTALLSAAFNYVMGGPYDYTPSILYAEQLAYREKLARMAGEIASIAMAFPDELLEGSIDSLRRHGVEPGRLLSVNGWMEVTTDRSLKFIVRGVMKALQDQLSTGNDLRSEPTSKPKRGRRKVISLGLQYFIETLAEFWTGTAGRRFTTSYTEGRVKSPVIGFIVDAIAPLDDVPQSAITSAARTLRATFRMDKKSPGNCD